MGDKNGQVVAGGNGQGNRLDQLYHPTDVLIDKETDNLIICDWLNQRVVRWSRRSGTTQGEILIGNILCYGLAMDDQRYLYISDYTKHEVRRYQIGDKNGTIVAGSNGRGDGLNQLNRPRYIFVDQQQTVYVPDNNNHRVMKWNKGAKEGIVVAGGQGQGNALTQLSYPYGLFVDTLGGFITTEKNETRYILLLNKNLFISTYLFYTHQDQQFVIHVQYLIGMEYKRNRMKININFTILLNIIQVNNIELHLMIRLIQRLLKYTSITHIDYQLLIDSLGKLREIAKKN
ncbi:unnamed protein product [Rotaria sordida]|uniref:Uncharacterized protein n=2 Tax=Rotaria sordida TaxID=392033 RepID=A0A815JMM1_9BILA|nr:unnamed protein product [Rotaria sordida]CAF1616993.1 unnamed protein product [Rotaria sordida]